MPIRKIRLALAILVLLGVSAASASSQTIRIATYNIEWLGAPDHPSTARRVPRLQAVIASLNADVIGLEEIADRAALRQIFPQSDWQILIDDQSDDEQNVAIAIRLPFHMVGHASGSNDIDAGDGDFLFPSDTSAMDEYFPGQRDILFAEIQVPGIDRTFTVMVDHAKSRSGGRDETDSRREGAAQRIVQALRSDFAGQDVVLLGDFNDNPDDVSINILETGDQAAAPGPDDISDDTFLVNLTEPLLAEDHVSWGLSQDDIDNRVLDTRVAGSREQNNATRGTAGVISPILFDQILVSPSMLDDYTVASVMVFDDPVAQQGNPRGSNPEGSPIAYASDHTPVVAELVAGAAPPPDNTPPPVTTSAPTVGSVLIVALLPNPVGDDPGHEVVTLRNVGAQDVSLAGWWLEDDGGNQFPLEGSLAAGEERAITLPPDTLPLNNDGDEVTLFSADGAQQDQVRYSESAAKSGKTLRFGD